VFIPYEMRGRLYPGHLSARCVDYSPCELCTGCRRYDGASMVCRICESGHKEKLICKHSERQWQAIRKISTALKRPMVDLNLKPGTGQVVEIPTDDPATNLGEELKELIRETPSRSGVQPNLLQQKIEKAEES